MPNTSRDRGMRAQARGRRGRPGGRVEPKTQEAQDNVEVEVDVEHAPQGPEERPESTEARFERIERSIEMIVELVTQSLSGVGGRPSPATQGDAEQAVAPEARARQAQRP